MMRHKMKRIRSKWHRIGTYNVCKFICLVLVILADGINSSAYFHKNIKNQ